MTKFCLEKNTDAWFEMEGGGQIHLQTLSSDELKAINTQTVENKTEFRRVDGIAERFEYPKTNKDLANKLFWDKIIIDWKNLYDSKENPIECTIGNKLFLVSESKKFLEFISESLEKLKEMNSQRIEDAEKN